MELSLLKILETQNNFEKYTKYIKDHAVTEETRQIVEGLRLWYKQFNKDVDWAKFADWFHFSLHPAWKDEKHQVYRAIFSQLESYEPDETDHEIISRFRGMDYMGRLADIALRGSEGEDVTFDELYDILEEYEAETVPKTLEDRLNIPSFAQVMSFAERKEGLAWRMEALNKNVGPIQIGDLIIMAGRPEAGKTSWLASEITHMAAQSNKPAIIFNNEEDGRKIYLRLYQAALNKTAYELSRMDPEKFDEEYKKALNGNQIIVVDDASLSTHEIMSICREIQPSVVFINMLPKVQGFFKEANDVRKLQKIAQWGRELAKQFAPVIGLWQANADAEGQKWLDQSMLDWSKTGAVGEADVLLLMGHSKQTQDIKKRFWTIDKNKMPMLNGEEKERQFVSEFDGGRARFRSL